MITGMLFTPYPCIYADVFQVRGEYRVEQQMVDAQPGILLPMLTEIIPKRVHPLFRVQVPQRVDPALGKQPLKALTAFWLEEGILEP